MGASTAASTTSSSTIAADGTDADDTDAAVDVRLETEKKPYRNTISKTISVLVIITSTGDHEIIETDGRAKTLKTNTQGKRYNNYIII